MKWLALALALVGYVASAAALGHWLRKGWGRR